MSSNLEDLLAGLPTGDDVSRWEDLSRKLGAEIAELSEKKARIDQLVEGARLIFGPSTPAAGDAAASSADNAPPATSPQRRVVKGAWTTAILQIAQEHPHGISYDEVRALLPEGLKEQVRQGNSKAFYGSMRRMEEDGLVTRFSSHLFTARGFEAFKQTAEYESLSRKGSAKRGSPVSDAVKAFLRENGPSKALVLKEHLCKIPEFRGPIKRNSSALYNILKRLVDRDELIHDKENSLFSLPQENGAPNGKPVRAPLAGEVGASPNESQPSLRLIG